MEFLIWVETRLDGRILERELVSSVERPASGVALHSNRFFRTFGANKEQKSPAINNLHDLSNHTFTLFPKSIQVVDLDRLVRSFLFEGAPKVRKNRFEYSVTEAHAQERRPSRSPALARRMLPQTAGLDGRWM